MMKFDAKSQRRAKLRSLVRVIDSFKREIGADYEAGSRTSEHHRPGTKLPNAEPGRVGFNRVSQVHSYVADLAAEVHGLIEAEGARLISIDGIDGCGKTTLANELRGHLHARVFHVDDFLQRHRDGYLAHIRYEELDSEVRQALREPNPVIVEGVCILSVLDRLALGPDLTLYCRNLDRCGLWFDGLYLEQWETAEEYIQHERDLRRRTAMLEDSQVADSPDLPGLEIDIIKYHFEFRPHETARFVFQWSTTD